MKKIRFFILMLLESIKNRFKKEKNKIFIIDMFYSFLKEKGMKDSFLEFLEKYKELKESGLEVVYFYAQKALKHQIKGSHTLIRWADSQEFMDKEWFNEEAILDMSGKHGDSAYFIPIERL